MKLPIIGNIPHGNYCYWTSGEWDRDSLLGGRCPYWVNLPNDSARCDLTSDCDSREDGGILWDQVKTCGIRDWQPKDITRAQLDHRMQALASIPAEGYEEQRALVERECAAYQEALDSVDGEADEW